MQTFSTEIKLSFLLRNTKSTSPTVIYAYLRFRGKFKKFPTGVKVLPKHWNRDAQFAVTGGKITALDKSANVKCNEVLELIRRRFKEVVEEVEGSDILDKVYGLLTGKEDCSLLDALNEVVKDKGAMYRLAVEWLSRYFKENPINVKELNKIYLEGFKEWFLRSGKQAIYMKTLCSCLKTSFKEANLKGLIDDDTYSRIAFYKFNIQDKANRVKPFLYDNEVIQLYNVTTETEDERTVVDLFILECTLGQRVGDTGRIDECVKKVGDKWILELVQQKTKKRVVCDILFKLPIEILERNRFNIPEIDISRYNRLIKKLAQRAGLDRLFEVEKHSATTTVEKKPLYSIISSHVGRHTFDALLRMRGYTPAQITKYSGHSEKEVLSYTAAFYEDRDIAYYEALKVKLEMIK